MRETWVWALGWEDPLEKEMAIHSSTTAWKIPWTEEPGRLQSMGSQRVGHNWETSLSLSNMGIVNYRSIDLKVSAFRKFSICCCCFFFFFFFIVFCFIFWPHWSSLLLMGFSPVVMSGGYVPSWCVGFSLWCLFCCGAQAPGHMRSVVETPRLRAQAQYLWLTGLIAPQPVGSSWTTDRTPVSCVGRQILNHWTTKEALCVHACSVA